jgi:integrase
MPHLTKRLIDSLQPNAAERLIFDDELKGFAVRVLPSGLKTYLVQYRASGRTRRVKVARHGTLTVEEARKQAKQILGDVAKGNNPAEVIAKHRRAPSVAEVCDRFYSDHVLERCKPTTQREYRRSLDLFIKPKLGPLKIGDIERADISRFHHELRDRPYQANRTLGVLSKMFNLCEVWGLRPDGSNPCHHVAKYPERKRETFLSEAEIARLGQVLADCQAQGCESEHAIAAFRLLILTGCRLSEIQTLKWSFVAGDTLHLPDTKTGSRRIPLSPDAQMVLAQLPKVKDNPYVIVGLKPGQPITDLQRPWRRIRQNARLDHVRIHDLRHTFASNAIQHGIDLPTIGKLLGHTQLQTTMRYAHLADDTLRKATAVIGASIGGALQAPSRRPSHSGHDDQTIVPLNATRSSG